MSERIESNSLLAMASFKGEMNRSGPDLRTRLSIANTTRKSSFDGFLNTFLGRDPDTGKAAKHSGPGSSPGAGLKAADRESLKKSMDKTVEGGADGEADADVAAAADEAAVLIWNLLYGYGGEGGAMPGSMPDSLRQLAGMLRAQSSLSGQPGLDPGAVEGAVETANACAEMNSSAILAGLDELLEGMPRQALDDALTRMAGQLGVPANGGFEGVLALLKGQVSSINEMSRMSLLGMLSASANPALAAENAGKTDASGGLEDALREFLAEKGDSPAGDEPVEPLAQDFAEWLKNSRKGASGALLSAEAEQFLAAASGGEEEKKRAFSEIAELLENLENSLPRNFQQNAPAPQQPGQTANVQNAHATTMTTMLEQMENIERLSEAMKMAAKGGVNNITMQLAPAELGRLVLRVESRNGVVSAKLRVERKEAADHLGASLHRLKDSLRALGIEIGDIDIEHEPATDASGDFLNELAAFGDTDGLRDLFA